MPVCEQCDGESFYEEDGHFFCDSCHMQSQDTQVEHQQEVDQENYNEGTRGLTLKSIGKNKSRRKFKNNDLGKPWTVYEGYQYLIKRLVEGLIAMGFSDQLKHVVGKLWFRYLKIKKVAFCPEEPDIITLKEHSGRTKNEGEWNTWLKKRRKLWKDDTTDAPVKAEDDFTMKTELPLDIAEENQKTVTGLLDGKDGLALSFDESSNSSINAITENNYGIEEKNQDQDEIESMDISNNNVTSYDSVGSCPLKKAPIFRMNQPTTLYFCYIGLRLLQEPVLLSDLMRWSHEGILAYYKASVVLPKEMKFAAGDHHRFSKKLKLLCDHDAFQDVALLYHTLGIDFAPAWEYVKLLVVPVLVDLDFSSAVQQLVWWLIDVDSELSSQKVHKDAQKHTRYNKPCEPDCHQCGKPITDFLVAAYIAVAVKMIYYLDDVHEVCNKTRSHLLYDLKLPDVENWTSWVTRTMIKRAKKLYSGIPREEDDLKYIHDLTVYEDFCVKDVFRDFNVREATQPYQNNMGTWRHRKDMTQLQDPRQQHFETYYSIARLVNSSLDLENVQRVGSSFPCSVDPLGNTVSCCGEMLKNGALNHTATCCVGKLGSNSQVADASHSPPETQEQDLCSEHSIADSSGEPTSQNGGINVVNVDLSANLCKDTTVWEERSITSKPSVEPGVPVGMNNLEGSTLANNVPAPCDDCYIHYTNDGEDGWSDSYRYLMSVMAQRMETLPGELQPSVYALETRLFGVRYADLSVSRRTMISH